MMFMALGTFMHDVRSSEGRSRQSRQRPTAIWHFAEARPCAVLHCDSMGVHLLAHLSAAFARNRTGQLAHAREVFVAAWKQVATASQSKPSLVQRPREHSSGTLAATASLDLLESSCRLVTILLRSSRVHLLSQSSICLIHKRRLFFSFMRALQTGRRSGVMPSMRDITVCTLMAISSSAVLAVASLGTTFLKCRACTVG
mmetsp:Transcript_52346/g.162370  ORF Transcript_52346/g.162370 Transcript_52346/m.162370 type:complete len:200 (+) Transcript_52346:273-872(+)